MDMQEYWDKVDNFLLSYDFVDDRDIEGIVIVTDEVVIVDNTDTYDNDDYIGLHRAYQS
jgi:hypothetical protein